MLFFIVLFYNCLTYNDSLDKFAPCCSNLQRTNIPICASSPNFRLVRNYFNLLHSALVWISRAGAVTRRLDIEDLHLRDEFSSTQQSPTLKCKLSQLPRYNIFKGWILGNCISTMSWTNSDNRDEICHYRRQSKMFASGVNFSRNNIFSRILAHKFQVHSKNCVVCVY